MTVCFLRGILIFADVFEHFIQKGGNWEVCYRSGEADKVSFKDIYLYTTGVNVTYYSWREKALKTSVYDAFATVDQKTLETWLTELQAPSEQSKGVLSLLYDEEKLVYSVEEVTQKIKKTLAKTYQKIWVRGEISNYRHASNGNI